MNRYATITGMVVCLLGVATIAQASTHHPKGITQAQAAKQYLADVAPSNALPQSTKPPAYAAAVDKLDALSASGGPLEPVRTLGHLWRLTPPWSETTAHCQFKHFQRVRPQRHDPEGSGSRDDRCEYRAV